MISTNRITSLLVWFLRREIGGAFSNGGDTLRELAVVVIFGFLPLLAIAQKSDPIPPEVAQEVREYRLDNEDLIIRELANSPSIPSIATETPNIQKNAAQVSKMLEPRGIERYLLPSKGRGPVVFGSLPSLPD